MVAICHVSIARVSGVGLGGSALTYESGVAAGTSQEITTGAVSAASTITIPDATVGATRSYVWRIENTGANLVYAVFGAAPTALATGAAGHGILGGTTSYFIATAAAEKVALIDQS
jgi:hypothetical protein